MRTRPEWLIYTENYHNQDQKIILSFCLGQGDGKTFTPKQSNNCYGNLGINSGERIFNKCAESSMGLNTQGTLTAIIQNC